MKSVMLAKQWSLAPELRSVGISDLFMGSIWQTNGISLDTFLRLTISIVLHICWLRILRLESVLSLGLWVSLRFEVVDTLNLELPIVIHAKTWSLSLLVEIAFAVDDGLKLSCWVFAADLLNLLLFPKPERNCLFFSLLASNISQ